MNCQLCDRRTFYYGKFTPCPDCKVTKSANIETREINGIRYYALKSASTEQKQESKEPAWITMAKNAGLLPTNQTKLPLKSAAVKQEKPYFIQLMEMFESS